MRVKSVSDCSLLIIKCFCVDLSVRREGWVFVGDVPHLAVFSSLRLRNDGWIVFAELRFK